MIAVFGTSYPKEYICLAYCYCSLLRQREALILQLYFVEELNLDEIGETLGVGAARVCQINKAALDKMKSMMMAE